MVTAGHQYEDLQVAVQLANRSGPLNALEFSEFVNAVQGLAEALDGATDLPDMSESVANGRELDSFAASCDVQLGVNVISDGAPVGRLRADRCHQDGSCVVARRHAFHALPRVRTACSARSSRCSSAIPTSCAMT